MTKSEYINELVEEVVSRAVDFGSRQSQENEVALACATEMLYDALNLLVES